MFLKPATENQHLWILLKAAILCLSWGAEFYSLQKIPLSLGMAVRSSGPFFTTAMTIFFFNEMPSTVEWIGIFLVIAGYFQFMGVARFHKQSGDLKYRYLVIMLGATLLGTVSGGIDRHLLKTTNLTPMTFLTLFSIYTPLLLSPAFIIRQVLLLRFVKCLKLTRRCKCTSERIDNRFGH